ncbi:MAG: hypothetical protein HQ521_02740 [Bacteroidetes bacterium]|nr:hypothetical protein [Bacteroidota bacterium]
MVTIIGAGWYGCYLGIKFKELGIEFEIIEKEDDLFKGSSSYNQNRLHLGYHYPRDFQTRNTSKIGFRRFIDEYPQIAKHISNNIYAVHFKSLIDFETYLSIYKYENYDFEILDMKQYDRFSNYQGMISVPEKLIDHNAAKEYFKSQSLPIKFNTHCYYKNDNIFSGVKKIESDIIFDCTYGQLKCPRGFFMEDYLSFVYKKKRKVDWGALTVMDGHFYSIYPFYDDYYTLTGVIEGVVDMHEYHSLGIDKYVNNRKNKLKNRIVCDYPDFSDDFEYSDFFISKKCKPVSNSNNRATHIIKHNNIYTICSGKIDTIFQLDELINRSLSKYI